MADSHDNDTPTDTDTRDTESRDTESRDTENPYAADRDTGTDLLGDVGTDPGQDDPAPEIAADVQDAAEEETEDPVEAEEAAGLASPFGAQFSSPEPTAVVARPRRRATRPAAAAAEPDEDAVPAPPAPAPAFISFVAPPADAPPAPRRRSRRAAEAPDEAAEAAEAAGAPDDTSDDEEKAPRSRRGRSRSRRSGARPDPADETGQDEIVPIDLSEDDDVEILDETDTDADDSDEAGSSSRRRRRGRRGRGRSRTGEDGDDADEPRGDAEDDEDADEAGAEGGDAEDDEAGTGSSTRRRRRRRRRGGSDSGASDDTPDDDDRPERAGRGGRLSSDDDVRGVAGSTRLEAKRQRRRDGRDTGRRRVPILTEAEFLARREAVDRAMVIRQRGERTQIAVLEDDVLVEHYVTQAQATSYAGNVYVGRVQNVLPSMEAAFVDIGKGRNAVLYAGEVNWDAAGLSGKSRSIETALKSGDKVVVQVTKDPIGHKGARLTQQVNLPGRFLVYVPGGSMTGISRKLPDTERTRLKDILKKIVPEDAGVIIRTAAEGASEEELTRDVNRLTAQWEVIQKKAESAQGGSGGAPSLLYGEPDLAIRVIRDVFNEDFKELVVQGDDAWDTVEAYVGHVSPELSGRLARYTGEGDVFHDRRIDEQLMKALDRKVWLPSGGSLVIDRTEAMTVVDVNTGKFVGSGGNLEQTVTRNNMEAAEEIVRQLRLRDVGGIIVIDFIDMVLESNRDLVLRRLTECLGRDRTKHQVAEVTSLGLVQMTRKRVGQGLLEVFSEPCEHCRGRGVLVSTDPVDEKRRSGGGPGGSGSGNSGSAGSGSGPGGGNGGRRDRSGGRDQGSRDSVARDSAVKDPVPSETVGLGTDADTTGVVPDGTDEVATGRSGRRSRGRRGRGQAGEEAAAADAAVLSGLADGSGRPDDTVEADQLPLPGVTADESSSGAPDDDDAGRAAVEAAFAVGSGSGDGPVAAADLPQVAPYEPAAVSAEDEVPAVSDLEPGGEPGEDLPAGGPPAPATGRPRRRRAASRPAGPPV